VIASSFDLRLVSCVRVGVRRVRIGVGAKKPKKLGMGASDAPVRARRVHIGVSQPPKKFWALGPRAEFARAAGGVLGGGGRAGSGGS